MSVRYPYKRKGEKVDAVGFTETFEGAVFETREKNGYDDSDFYAVVWDEETKTLKEEYYASTRYAGGGYAEADLTEGTLARANEFLKPKAKALLVAACVARRSVPKVGDEVVVKRGKFKGNAGRVFWVGPTECYTYGSPALTRCGVSPSGEVNEADGKYSDTVWTKLEYCAVTRDVEPTPEELTGFDEKLDAAPLAAYNVVRNSTPLGEGWVRM